MRRERERSRERWRKDRYKGGKREKKLEHNPKRNHITYQEEVRERKVQKEKERERG